MGTGTYIREVIVTRPFVLADCGAAVCPCVGGAETAESSVSFAGHGPEAVLSQLREVESAPR